MWRFQLNCNCWVNDVTALGESYFISILVTWLFARSFCEQLFDLSCSNVFVRRELPIIISSLFISAEFIKQNYFVKQKLTDLQLIHLVVELTDWRLVVTTVSLYCLNRPLGFLYPWLPLVMKYALLAAACLSTLDPQSQR